MSEKNQSFGRIYHLSLEVPLKTYTNRDGIVPLKKSTNGIIEITDNRLLATIYMTSVGEVSSTKSNTVSVFNLSQNIIDLVNVKGVKLVLRAGYLSENINKELKDLPVILQGEVVKTKVTLTGNDKVLLMTVVSSAEDIKTKTLNTKIQRGTVFSSALEQICEPFTSDGSVTIDYNVGNTTFNKVVDKTINYSTTPLEALDDFLKRYDLTGTLINDTIMVREKNTVQVNNYTYDIDLSRVKGGVELTCDFTKSSTNKEEGIDIDFTMFLDSRIKLGSNINVSVNGNIGTFLVNALTYRLDSHGDAWDVSVTATSVYKTDILQATTYDIQNTA